MTLRLSRLSSLAGVVRLWVAMLLLVAGARPAQADDVPTLNLPPPVLKPPATVQTPVDALAEDAREYAGRFGVSLVEAISRLHAQEASVAATDRLAAIYRERLAGIVIEHSPIYRIVVTLTGPDPVPAQTIDAGGRIVPVMFRTGAGAAREQILAAIVAHQQEMRDALRDPPGMGVDPRTGEMVVIVSVADRDAAGADVLQAELQQIAEVPLHLHVLDGKSANFEVDGGARVEGIEPSVHRRFACTSGFLVTDGTRNGVTTAAHCPDDLTYVGPGGERAPLQLLGAWGARYQDVQIHATDRAIRPLFYADTAKTLLRPVTSWRNRASTRAGDFVCHRGERTGYSCATVALTDFAPAGDLCAGPCPPDWVVVEGPGCNHGDSGGPVFAGTVAFGLLKGGSYQPDGRCNFYYYMSTDYLPPGWTVMH